MENLKHIHRNRQMSIIAQCGLTTRFNMSATVFQRTVSCHLYPAHSPRPQYFKANSLILAGFFP